MRGSWAIACLLLLAGCVSGDEDPTSTPEPSSSPSTRRTVQAFSQCDELDFYRPIPYDRTGFGPLVPVPTDPAGTTMNILYTAMRCASLDRDGSVTTDPSAIFTLFSVEELDGHEVEGAAGYLFMRSITTPLSSLSDDWSNVGVETAVAPVDISFGAVGANAKASASFSVESRLHSVSGDSTMAGSPEGGTGGVLGLYTLANRTDVHVHRIDFSDYRVYPNGAVVLRPGIAGVPANSAPAYHNIDYDVRFGLNTAEGSAT
jgi:hypothetical protein